MKRIALHQKRQYKELRQVFKLSKGDFIKKWFDSKQDLFGSSSVRPVRVCATVIYLQPLNVSVNDIFPKHN